MALSSFDISAIKDFIECQIQFSLNDKELPDAKDIDYLLLLAETGSKDVSQKLAASDLDILVASYLIEPLTILQNRRHIIESDGQIIKLHIRLAIIEYLKDFSSSMHSLSNIEKVLNEELCEIEVNNKRQLLEEFKSIYNSLRNNLFTKEKLYQVAEGVFIFSLLAAGYLFYNFGKVFLNVGGMDATSVANLLYENVWPTFPYPIFSLIASGALVLCSNHFGKKLQRNINAAYFVGMTQSGYPNIDALLQAAQEKIASLEKELKNHEIQLRQEFKGSQSQSASYRETAALLTQNETTQFSRLKETNMSGNEENDGLVAVEPGVAIEHETEDLVAGYAVGTFRSL